METFIHELVGAIVWVLANLAYADHVRRGRGGFLRFLTFWSGMPVTFLTHLFLREGSRPDILPPPDDEEALLREVRAARSLHAGQDHPLEPEPPEGT